MISSNSNPRIKQVVQWQTKAKQRNADGIFIVEGKKMLLEAPKDWLLQVYVSERFLADGNLLPEDIPYEVVSDSVFAKISDTQTPQGVLGVLKRPQYTLEELLKRDKDKPSCQTTNRTAAHTREENANPKKQLLVMLEDLQDPGNLGTIIRTAEGAGVSGIILSKGCVDLFNPKVVRSTMGSIYRVPFLYVEDFRDTLQKVKNAGIHTYAAHLSGKKYYDSFDFSKPTAFLIGNEGNGLTKETADMADDYLLIPMEGQLESLNAAVATALLIYEAHRQRQ